MAGTPVGVWVPLDWLMRGILLIDFMSEQLQVLGEIDSMYAGIESVDNAVYLEWLAPNRPEILRAFDTGGGGCEVGRLVHGCWVWC